MMTTSIRCLGCQGDNPLGNKFCRHCGASMVGAGWADEPAIGPEGSIDEGVWHRPPSEIARRVPPEALRKKLFRAGVTVPTGSVAVIILDGVVQEVLAPGFRTTETWVSRLTSFLTDRLDRADIVLVDVRPLAIPILVDRHEGGAATKYQLLVDARVRRESVALGRFVSEALGDRDALDAKTFYDTIHGFVTTSASRHLGALPVAGAALESAARAVESELASTVGERFGMAVGVRVAPVRSVVSLDVRIGAESLPTTRPCAECGAALASSKKFCTKCGASQPVLTQPSRSCTSCGTEVSEGKKFCTKCGARFVDKSPTEEAVLTKDGESIEADVALRVEGTLGSDAKDRVTAAVAAAIRKHAREAVYDEIVTATGFGRMEVALRGALSEALAPLGLELADVVLLDLRSQGKTWVLGARAELDLAIRETAVGREWLGVEEGELDLRAAQLEVLLRAGRVEREHALARNRDELAEREKLQELAGQRVKLDVADAQRVASTAVTLDAVGRERDRAIAAATHADRLTEAGQRATEMRQALEFTHELEKSQQQHEVEAERTAAEHDAALARAARELDSETAKRGADDRAYATRVSGHADAEATRARDEVVIATARGKQELELDAEAKRQAMQVDKLRAMAELDATIREDELRAERQKQEHEARLREQLRGLSTDQMLAMQAGGQGGEAIAAALAEKFKAEGAAGVASAAKQQELYERMLAEQKAAQAALLQMTGAARAQIAEVVSVLGEVTRAAVAGQREATAATNAAQDRSAAMATEIAGRSVSAMAQAVGATPARERPRSGRSLACTSCGREMDPSDAICGECGARAGK